MKHPTQVDNEILAEFLGWEKETNGAHDIWYHQDGFGRYVAASGQLKFERDWNELMKVVDFIGTLKYPMYPQYRFGVTIHNRYSQIDCGPNTLGVEGTFFVNAKISVIERTFNVCVRFAKWWKDVKNTEDK